MKTCSDCKEEKDYSEFNKSKNRADGYQHICKKCKSLRYKKDYTKNKTRYLSSNQKRREKWREFINSFKTKCTYCEEVLPLVLDFHHTGDKKYEISDFRKYGYNESKRQEFLNEIENCIVVCSNCHRKIHGGYITVE